jgi:hypothetical protein
MFGACDTKNATDTIILIRRVCGNFFMVHGVMMIKVYMILLGNFVLNLKGHAASFISCSQDYHH